MLEERAGHIRPNIRLRTLGSQLVACCGLDWAQLAQEHEIWRSRSAEWLRYCRSFMGGGRRADCGKAGAPQYAIGEGEGLRVPRRRCARRGAEQVR